MSRQSLYRRVGSGSGRDNSGHDPNLSRQKGVGIGSGRDRYGTKIIRYRALTSKDTVYSWIVGYRRIDILIHYLYTDKLKWIK